MNSAPVRADPATPRLALTGISKRYPSVVANDGIDLAVAPGEIHAVLGENGAGKSTLMKIIYGMVRPDAGRIAVDGVPVTIAGPAAARALGIGMVFQHFSLFETLTVADNIALALRGGSGRRALAARIRDVSRQYGLPLDPARYVHTMAVGERQRVEIVRCLLQQPRLLIMDEPTSVLAPPAIAQLFTTLRTLAAEGVSILYISHKLDEIRTLCERATVLRAGRVTGECDPRRESVASLARMMIGGELPHPRHAAATPGATLLAVDRLSLPALDPFGVTLDDVSLAVRAGEIVGIAGISGNGQRELVAAISGERTVARADAVRIGDAPVGRLDADARRALGMAYVPEERIGRAAIPVLSLAENALLTARRQGLVARGFIRRPAMRAFAARVIAAFGVRAPGPDAAAESLSGGNLQKFIVGREMQQAPRVFVAAHPTWGVDVGAAAQIRQALVDLRDRGVAVLVTSDELDELFEISDRIAVMAGGRLSAAMPAGETSAEAVGVLMAGPRDDARAAA